MGRWGGHLAVGVGEVGDEVGGQAREDGEADLRRTPLCSAPRRVAARRRWLAGGWAAVDRDTAVLSSAVPKYTTESISA